MPVGRSDGDVSESHDFLHADLAAVWVGRSDVRPAAEAAPLPTQIGAFEEVLEDPMAAAESL